MSLPNLLVEYLPEVEGLQAPKPCSVTQLRRPWPRELTGVGTALLAEEKDRYRPTRNI